MNVEGPTNFWCLRPVDFKPTLREIYTLQQSLTIIYNKTHDYTSWLHIYVSGPSYQTAFVRIQEIRLQSEKVGQMNI